MRRGPISSQARAGWRLCLAALVWGVLGACASPDFVTAAAPGWQDPAANKGRTWVDEEQPGRALAYDIYGQPSAGAPAILFLHGWCENRNFWKPTAMALQEDSLCVTVDLPGYGASLGGSAEPDPVAWAESLVRFAQSIHGGPWVVVGHSLGGVVALEAARILQTGRQARGVVVVHGLYDPNREFDGVMNQAFANSLMEDFPGQIRAFVNAMVPPRSAGALSGWVAGQMQATDVAVAVAGLTILEDYKLAHCLKELRVPVRAINATMRATNTSANQRLIADFDVFFLESIEGSGLDLMLQDPTGFRSLLERALFEFQAAAEPSSL